MHTLGDNNEYLWRCMGSILRWTDSLTAMQHENCLNNLPLSALIWELSPCFHSLKLHIECFSADVGYLYLGRKCWVYDRRPDKVRRRYFRTLSSHVIRDGRQSMLWGRMMSFLNRCERHGSLSKNSIDLKSLVVMISSVMTVKTSEISLVQAIYEGESQRS